MSKKILQSQDILNLINKYQTPAFFYDYEVMQKRVEEVQIFDVVRFAQKACSNISILKLMRKWGVYVDAVSAGEVLRAIEAGYKIGPNSFEVVYTADLFDRDAKKLIQKYSPPVNIGSPDMLTQLAEFSPNSPVILRINPGFGHGHSQKVNTGGDLSKHGIWYEDIQYCLDLAEKHGIKIVGLHIHIGSGADFEHLSQICDTMIQLSHQLKGHLKLISAGGGLPIPYHENEDRIDLRHYYNLWEKSRKAISEINGFEVKLEVEPGRYLVAESGFLIAQICSIKKMKNNWFYLIDAGFDNLVRPAMYGAYHQIEICSKSGEIFKEEEKRDVIVAGPLCESCDVFTQSEGGLVETRKLPNAKVGDFVVIRDTGAYGAVMSSNYNTRLLAPEILIRDQKGYLIRSRQSFEQLLGNEIEHKLKFFN